MRTPGPWEAVTGTGSTAVYVEGTKHAVAVGLNQSDAEFIAAMPNLFKLAEQVLEVAAQYANEAGNRHECIRQLTRELRRLPQ